MAKMQAYTLEFATNLADLGPYGYVVSFNPTGNAVNKAGVNLCSEQRIRNTGGYQTFSFLGLMIVVCVGSLIIILSWIVEPIVGFVRNKTKNKKHDCREIARIADHKLQLQRMALMGVGYEEEWDPKHAMDFVPVTRRDTLFPLPSRTKTGGDDYRYSTLDPLSSSKTPGTPEHHIPRKALPNHLS